MFTVWIQCTAVAAQDLHEVSAAGLMLWFLGFLSGDHSFEGCVSPLQVPERMVQALQCRHFVFGQVSWKLELVFHYINKIGTEHYRRITWLACHLKPCIGLAYIICSLVWNHRVPLLIFVHGLVSKQSEASLAFCSLQTSSELLQAA
jgi:hypothetical protein